MKLLPKQLFAAWDDPEEGQTQLFAETEVKTLMESIELEGEEPEEGTVTVGVYTLTGTRRVRRAWVEEQVPPGEAGA